MRLTLNISSESDNDELIHTDYRFQSVRLHTFANWNGPTVNNRFPELLAAAGLYYTGEGDKVKCFDCHIVISDWKDTMDPMTEHRQKFPNCRFVRMMPCGDVPIGIDANLIPARVPRMKEILQLDPSGLNLDKVIEVYFEYTDVYKRVRLGDLIEAKFPAFAYYESRLFSYAMWPETVTQKKEDLASAGFICQNKKDRVICFFCGGSLQKWQPGENPFKEHIKWFPNCKFIKRLLID